MLREAAVLLLAASLPVVVASPASAATITVDVTTDLADPTPGDSTCGSGPGTCSLRAAIQTANAIAGADTISLPAGTYTLSIDGTDEDAAATGDLDVTDDLTITGAGAAASVVDADSLDRVFHAFDTPGTAPPLSLAAVTVTGGATTYGGGGIRSEVGIALDGVDVIGNAADNGGGLALGGEPELGWVDIEIVSSHIDANTALSGGGIVVDSNWYGTLRLTDSTVDGNVGGFPAGVQAGSAELLRSSASANVGAALLVGDLTLTDATIDGNVTDNGWVVITSDSLTVLRSSLSDNDGVAVVAAGSVSVVDSSVDRNMGGIFGGANTTTSVVVSGSSISANDQWGLETVDVPIVSISDSHIDGNGGTDPTGELAAGVSVRAPVGTVTITDTTIDGNAAVEGVGGLFVEGGVTTVERTSIAGNVGGLVGGARIGDGTVTDATIAGNAGSLVGGLEGGDVAMSASTVSGNTSSGGVGGVAMAGAISFTTLASNDGATEDAARFDGDVEVQASVFAGIGPTPLCGGTGAVTSLGASYATDASCGLGAGVGDVSGGVDPLLGPLMNNGGPTLTRLPPLASPLVDAAAAACAGATDQRGVSRPQGSACDIGAVELEHGAAIAGQITADGAGDPLVAMSVRLLSTAGALLQVTTTDVDGLYAFDDLAPGSYKVRFVDPSGLRRNELFDGSTSVASATPVVVAADAVTIADADLALHGGVARGQVTQQGSGANLAGISVRLLTEGNVLVGTRLTAADGRYSFGDVPAGSYVLRFVDLDGSHLSEYHDDAATFPAATPVAVVAGATTTVDAQLPSAATGDLIGTVTEEGSGTGLAGISVRLLTTGNVLVGTRTTQVGGTYTFFDVLPGSYIVRFVDGDGSHSTEYHLDAAAFAGATPVDVDASTATIVDAQLAPT